MTLSFNEQDALHASNEAKVIRERGGQFGLLMGAIESAPIKGKVIYGQAQALAQLNRAIGAWSGQVDVTSAYRNRAQQKRASIEGKYGQDNELSMHMSGQAFDLNVSKQDQGRFEEHMQKYGFYNTLGAKDRVHFVYDGGGNAFRAATSRFAFSDSVSSIIKETSGRFNNVQEADLRAIIHIESGGKTGLTSETDVRGIAQITGDTWKRMNPGKAYSTDPAAQIDTAARIFSSAVAKYGDTGLAAMAYNIGDPILDRALKLSKEKHIVFGEALELAIEKNLSGSGKKIFTEKQIRDFGGVKAAAQKKTHETLQYRDKFESARLGVDFKADIYARHRDIVQAPNASPSDPHGDKADGKDAIQAFFDQAGKLEGTLDLLNNDLHVAKMGQWLRDNHLVTKV